jgi:signal transduction histidine kinase
MSHPLLIDRENLFYYVFIWLIIALFQTLILHYQFSLEWRVSRLDSLISNVFYSAMALSFWYPCRYISLEQKNRFTILFNHLSTGAIASLVWLGFIYIGMIKMATAGEAYQQFFNKSLPWRFFIGILFYLVMVSVYYLFIYYHNLQDKEIQEAELKILVKEAELKSLKFQINPHFIFNSLNSINSLILTDSSRASEMTVKLSEFLRSTLSGSDIPTRLFSEELKTARLYLDIEKIRFGDKIIYTENIEPQCLDATVPGMLLQPLIENAIKHGVYESIQPVKIELTCYQEGDYLEIILENNYDPETISSKGEGIGLKNIRSRLEMMYTQTKFGNDVYPNQLAANRKRGSRFPGKSIHPA